MIKNILNEIATESSTNKKVEILANYKDNKLLEKVLYMANSPRIKFYIKQIPIYQNNIATIDLPTALDKLNKLSSREITGNAAISFLSDILSNLPEDDAYVIERIIEKDLRIYMGSTLINKIYPKLIEKSAYMGCLPFDISLVKEMLSNGSAFSQVKMDGRYSNAIIQKNMCDLESRQGEPTYLSNAKFAVELSKFEDCVLNGEFTIKNKTRYESNGIIASLVSIADKMFKGNDVTKDISKFNKENDISYTEGLDSVVFTLWDCISIEEYFAKKSNTPYHIRLENLKQLLAKHNCENVELIESKLVTTIEEAISDFQDKLQYGFEGTVLKQYDGIWSDGKRKNQIKFKLEMNVDLKVVGFNYGKKGTKNEHLISSVNVKSSDGIVNTRAAGINEKDMKYITENQDFLMGKILECKSCGLSKNEKGEYALLHPVFIKFRDDKDLADSFDDIVKIENMAKSL